MKKKLKDVCDFYSGTGFPTQYQGEDKGDYPFYKVSDIAKNVIVGNIYLELCSNYIDDVVVKKIKGCILPENTVVFAKIGEALKLNRRAITSCACLVDNNVMGIAPRSEVLRIQYFYFLMKNLQLQTLAESTTVPSVRKTRLEKYEIEVPSLLEQEEIEKKLIFMQKVITKRKLELLSLDNLVKARFVEMFGDPVINSKNLATKELKNVMALKAGDFTVASDILDEPSESNPYPCYGGNGVRGYVAEYNQEGEYSLIGRQGALSGNVQYVNGKFKNTEHALLVTPLVEINSIWLNQLLLNLDLKRYQTGAAQPGISVKNLQEIPIVCVSIDEQNQFADFVRQIAKSKAVIEKSLKELETLQDSLMQKYFS